MTLLQGTWTPASPSNAKPVEVKLLGFLPGRLWDRAVVLRDGYPHPFSVPLHEISVP